MSKTAYEVEKTIDYNTFKRLDGNRPILEARVKKIINSINTVGYIISPIVVNEKYEVIDGQGRLEALKRLHLPVYYIVVPGIGIDECIAMNMNQTNWTMLDYIQSHAETGNVSYMHLLQLINAYGKTFKLKVIMHAVTGKSDYAINIIKDGRFICTSEDYSQAKRILAWLSEFVPIVSRVNGHTEYYYMALSFCHQDEEVDDVRLLNKMASLQANLIPVTTIQQALEQIEDIYNNRAKKKVYIKTNYRKYMDEKYGWYSNKYGDKYEED